ncbi:hypothetical protein DH2020_002356 [Rehmannia glutinosa]|uniref:DNA repair protein RAD51 homolog 3 n=1 Tax=Rehmannia glutinosa TaxID=99300 RepID=A0ABR0XU30_REHGL
MEVSSLPISASHRGKLISAGYSSLSSLSSVSPSKLAQDLKISENEVLKILKVVSARKGGHRKNTLRVDISPPLQSGIPFGVPVPPSPFGCFRLPSLVPSGPTRLRIVGQPFSPAITRAQTAWDILHEEESSICITTSCSDLDEILGGGIRCKEVTEIDTEGSFMVERASQIAEACAEDMLEYNSLLRKDSQACRVDKPPKAFMDNIFYFRICTYTEQIAVVNYLEKFINEHKDIKIVIIDSITFHFRQEFEDMALRTRLLSGMALKLMKLAKKFNLAVVLLNQVTTKYNEGSFQLTLALGDSWAHASTNRIILYWNGNERYAYIDKSPSMRSASAPYAVTSRGIRNSASNCKRVKLM